jgi:endo-1,4-beta-xylanase
VKGLLAAWFVVAAIALFGTWQVAAQTVQTYGFEDGTADGWSSFNGASTPVATTNDAYTGTHSLLTTTGASGSGGPAINLSTVLQAGAKYTITGYLKLTPGENPANANFTIRRTDTDGTHYDTVGSYQVAVSANGWAQIGGSYTASQTETALTLYAQLVGATSAQSFYLDQVVITQTAPPPGGAPVASWNFNDGGLDGWERFGTPTLTNVISPTADPLGNTHSLSVTNRTAAYMGPGINLQSVSGVTAGATYQVTAYVMLQQPDSTNPTISLSTQTDNCANPNGSYGTIATGAVSNTAWTKVQGTFSFSNVPGAPSSLVLYLQSSSATDSFYVSGVSITQLAPAPLSPDQQDNSGITSTFEDGALDGWSSRAGAALANSTDTAHSGTHSLSVSNRSHNYDGPQINVSNKMYVGSVYNLSVWVRLAPTDGSTHVINMSLQTTLNGTTSYPSVTPYPGITVAADGQWHQISVLGYTMSSAYDPGQAFLYLQTVPSSGNDLVSFYVDDFQLTYVQPPQIEANIPSIYQTLAQYFPVGAAVDMTDLTGAHAQLWAKHFNSMTPGNDLKWSSVEPNKGQYNYTNGDALVGLAVCNAAKVRGQNLVWATGQQTPAYAYGDGTNTTTNQATVTANIQEHIQNEVQHFGTKVYAWDVVNEPIDPKQPDCLVHGPFYNVLGKSYIDVAFQAARQYAPPGTKLFLNEYSTADANRLACLVKVVQDLQLRGIPIDGIGHEEHNAINYPSPAAILNSINAVAAQLPGIDQQVTELDESVYNAGDTKSNYGNNVPPAVLAEQGWLYKSYFDVFRQMAGKVSAVTLWGMADDDTWLDSFPVARTDYPLPFDMGLQAKPAYWGIVDPTKLPGYGLSFAISAGPIVGTTETWTVTATNPSSGPAYATQVNGFQLVQLPDAGKPCSPTVMPGSFPVSLGDVPANGKASVSFTVDFSGCRGRSQFTLTMPWSSAVYNTGTFTYQGQYFPEANSPNAQ